MIIRTSAIRSGVAALALIAGLGCAGMATASTSPVISVQDQDGHDGATVDSDGTQGDSHVATEGSATGPLMDAVPQYKAK